jgi:beta-xylosidase
MEPELREQLMRPWTDTSVPLAERVDSLLGEMTLDEKLAQLASVWIGAELGSGNVAPLQEAFADPVSFSRARSEPGPLIRSRVRAASPGCSGTSSRGHALGSPPSRTTSA